MYKNFGYTIGGVFSGLGLWQLVGHGRLFGFFFVVIGASFLLMALIAPESLKPVYRYWMKLGHALGWVNTRVILFLLYIAVFVPTGFILKILRKDLLDQRIAPGQKSYWIRKTGAADPMRYEKQY
jgi:hypothetical protein